jgi:hypothetical protein
LIVFKLKCGCRDESCELRDVQAISHPVALISVKKGGALCWRSYDDTGSDQRWLLWL